MAVSQNEKTVTNIQKERANGWVSVEPTIVTGLAQGGQRASWEPMESHCWVISRVKTGERGSPGKV